MWGQFLICSCKTESCQSWPCLCISKNWEKSCKHFLIKTNLAETENSDVSRSKLIVIFIHWETFKICVSRHKHWKWNPWKLHCTGDCTMWNCTKRGLPCTYFLGIFCPLVEIRNKKGVHPTVHNFDKPSCRAERPDGTYGESGELSPLIFSWFINPISITGARLHPLHRLVPTYLKNVPSGLGATSPVQRILGFRCQEI